MLPQRESVAAQAGGPRHDIPTGAILVSVAIVCIGLAMSAIYGYFTLSRLRSEYLQNRAQEMASALNSQAHGPGRRNNPVFWQSLIEDSFEGFGTSVAFLAVVDSSGRELAGKSGLGPKLLGSGTGNRTIDGHEIAVFDFPLGPPLQPNSAGAPMIAGWRIRVGLFTSTADFIRRQAALQTALTALAIGLLLGMAAYIVRMLRRYVSLQAREQSERHLKSLGVMSATLAHEIRNPLGAMKGLTQLALEGLPADHKAQGLMKTVVTEAERLEKLVADLLTFAGFRPSGARKFDYLRLIAEVRAGLDAQLPEAKQIEVVTGFDSLPMRSDEDGLRQVVLNVLLNALDFTPPGGKVAISVSSDKESKMVITDVEDSGPGIGNRDPEQLFEPFVTTKAKGTGLGLAVSRQIVETLGGTIALANLPGGGARCTIIVPRVN